LSEKGLDLVVESFCCCYRSITYT